MKIKIANAVNSPQYVSEVVDLKAFDLSVNYSLKGIKPFTLNVTFETFEEIVEVHMDAEVELILECAYTLEHFSDTIDFEEFLTFNFKKPDVELESDDAFYEKGPLITLDDYVFALILTYIPLKVIKPGAKLPSGGEDYGVFSEEEYAEQKRTLGEEKEDIFSTLDIDED